MTDQPDENFGPVEVWQIREFPKGLRQYVAEEARREGIKVGELLTRIVVAYRGGNLGALPQNRFANPSTGLTELERLAKLAWMTRGRSRARPVQEVRRQILVRLRALPLPEEHSDDLPRLPPPPG